MTISMHLAAALDAPIACDMSTASDTPAERLAEYRRLFERSLLRRERRDGAVVFVFRADSAPQVADLARREAECCPFLEYRLEPLGDQVIWTIADPEGRASASAILDEFYALPERPR
jgi:hypothetical protein